MPNLHYYDTGLVCRLPGIRTPQQLRAHPLRCPIFMTWIVSEIAKHRANKGESKGISFYRDRNGAEADLIVENPIGNAIVEAKSSKTASSCLFDRAKCVRGHLAQSTRRCSAVVVYGGDRPRRKGTDSLIPWRELHEFDRGASDCIVTVRAAGMPVSGAIILALFPIKTWKCAAAEERGAATLDLYSAELPMTVFAAAKGFAAHLGRSSKPVEGPLDVELSEIHDGGAVIFSNNSGHVPNLRAAHWS